VGAVVLVVVLAVIVVGVWALIAYARAGTKAAAEGIDKTQSPGGPSLLEEDLSFAGREDEAGDVGDEVSQSQSERDHTASQR
jgi:hypothetical protein